MKEFFGTDGIRGIANIDLTPEFALKLGRILGKYFKKGKIILGTDTRISKDMIGFALQSGILSQGLDVLDVGVIPTPAISYLTKTLPEVVAGVMISASHNPMEYNGIKIFGKDGLKLSDEIELEIEKFLKSEINFDRPVGENLGKSINYSKGKEIYKDFLKKVIPVDLSGWKIFMDCANGSVSEVGPELFRELGGEIVAWSCDYNGININANCGAVYPQMGLEEFKKSKAKIGFSYDGDGDRVIVFADDSTIVDGDKILGIFAVYLKEKNLLKKDTVVGTIMTNLGLEEYLKGKEISLIRTKVGDKNILDELIKKDLNLGGEASGHIILFDYSPTGDGLLTSLFLLKILVEEGINLSDLSKVIPQYPQKNNKIGLRNRKLSQEELEEIKKIVEEVVDGEKIRYIVRPSGTEPVLRITLEGDVPENLLEEKMNIIVKRLGLLLGEEVS